MEELFDDLYKKSNQFQRRELIYLKDLFEKRKNSDNFDLVNDPFYAFLKIATPEKILDYSPEMLKHIDSAKQKIETIKHPYAEGEGLYPCNNPVCLSKNTISRSEQTRSGDEGATIFVTCLDCGRTRKINN